MNPAQIARIVLVTDFGAGIYPGQMKARLSDSTPRLPVIDLVHDLAPFRPDLAAYLLPALVRDMPSGTLYLCVVDPGVGGERAGLVVAADGNWFIGPDNGLLSRVVARAVRAELWHIGWEPRRLSASFHGRDWFAPAALRLLSAEPLGLSVLGTDAMQGWDWPDLCLAVVYVDRYGNCICGLKPADLPPQAELEAGGQRLRRARTFSEVARGEPFWYENALGLVEIAVNQGRADDRLGLAPGASIEILEPTQPG